MCGTQNKRKEGKHPKKELPDGGLKLPTCRVDVGGGNSSLKHSDEKLFSKRKLWGWLSPNTMTHTEKRDYGWNCPRSEKSDTFGKEDVGNDRIL